MTNLTNYPYPSYETNKPAAGVLAALVGISAIAWIVQSIMLKFRPVRLNVLLLISHLTIFIELILRGALPAATRNARAGFTASTVLLAIGLRSIILANYDYLIRVLGEKHKLFRPILLGSFLLVITSAVLTAPAGTLSYDPDTVTTSFRLRQASAALLLLLTVVFYPVWFLTKRAKDKSSTEPDMTKQAIVLLIIASICCLAVAVYLVITSVPSYYIGASEDEMWFYIFQLTPILIALFSWTIFHPLRSLKQNPQE